MVELSKLMGCDIRISTPTNGSTSDVRHDVIKRRGLNVRVHGLPYQRYTKSSGHYSRINDILITPYPTPHILSVGIVGVDREVRIKLSNQGSEGDARPLRVVTSPYAQSSYVSPNLTHLVWPYTQPKPTKNVELLTGFLVFLSSKPITLKNRGKEGGGFFGSSHPNYDTKGWKKKTKKKRKKKGWLN